MLSDIYKHHYIQPNSFSFPTALTELLDDKGYTYRVFPVEDNWLRKGSVSEISERFADDLKEYGAEPDNKSIRDIILKHSADGITISYTVEVILKLVIVNKLSKS